MPHVRALLLLLVVASGTAGCKQSFNVPVMTQDAGAEGGLPGIGVGGGCARDPDCRAGLVCAPDRKSCQPPGNKVPGSTCILSAECLPGNHCAMGTCKPSGQQPEGGPCANEGDCATGLVCSLVGLSGTCAKAGPGDLGAACMATTGCRAGLVCASGTCQTMPMVMPPTVAKCSEEEEATPRVHFRVPRAGETNEDFYQLPFPNDIRLKNGKVDLSGHPRPGPGILGFDVVDRYIKAIEAESTGFSVNPAVYFRFSRKPKFDTLRMADAVTFYNITPGSPHYGLKGQPGWYTSTGREKYLCPRWIFVRHGFGAPLRPGETYAYVIKRIVTDESGAPMQQDDDFKAMLGASAPAGADLDLAAAWRAYAPLRAWITDKQIDAASLAAAAVFTTERLEEPLAKMRQVVRAAPAPVIKNLVRCGDPTPSPCDDGKTGSEHVRGCMGVSSAYEEYQGTVSIPVFQKGMAPYDQPADGGGIELDASGAPRIQRTEDVCFALTIPRTTAPAAGWPVVVYSHGTGGNYRGAIEPTLAFDYATGESPGGAAVPMATFGYDGVLHGSRKGTSTRPVTELVYNFLNPQAARDNAVQAAGDLFAVARAIETFSAGGIKLDAGKIALYGHSQGGNAAANAAGYEPLYGAVVLSGTGGGLILSLLHKMKPVNVALIIPLVLGEASVSERHPVLNLLQMYLDRADSVNFGRRLFADPPAGIPARHVLQIYGTDDTYSPVETQRTFATAAGFDIVGPVLDPVDMMDIAGMHRRPALAGPARGNFAAPGGKQVTAVEAQYKPSGNYDGHFVSTGHARARAAIQQMLTTFFRDGTPTVTP